MPAPQEHRARLVLPLVTQPRYLKDEFKNSAEAEISLMLPTRCPD